MRILVTIPHYFYPEKIPRFGSEFGNPTARIKALTKTIQTLHRNFHSPQCILNAYGKTATSANHSEKNLIDIVICTTGDRHILFQLPLLPTLYRHNSTQAEPRMLGFECQSVLKENLGKYDYYCFLEDDLAIHDPWFFRKLHWFSKSSDSQILLQPNRYEVSMQPPFFKGYIDGEIDQKNAASYQNINERFELRTRTMGFPVIFRRTNNPHSGCFFLNGTQMEYWAAKPHFLDFDISFVDPMASAATLGILKTFNIYKPAAENADFLEVEHTHRCYLYQVGTTIKIQQESFVNAGYRVEATPKEEK